MYSDESVNGVLLILIDVRDSGAIKSKSPDNFFDFFVLIEIFLYIKAPENDF